MNKCEYKNINKIKTRKLFIKYQCENCDKIGYKYPSQLKHKHHFCSRSCRSGWIARELLWKNEIIKKKLLKNCKNLYKISPLSKPGWHHTREAKEKISKAGMGRKLSIETRKKISLGKLGKPLSEKHRQALVDGYRNGRINPNKGKKMSKEQKNKISISNILTYSKKPKISRPRCHHTTNRFYIKWRKSVFERDKYTCLFCNESNHRGVGKTIQLNAHHVAPWSYFDLLRYDVNNGITVCINCHKKINSKSMEKEIILKNSKCHDCGKKLIIGDEFITYVIGNQVFYKDKKCHKVDSVLRNYQKVECYSRVVGYIRPVEQWNPGKKAEFKDRKNFKVK